MTGSLQTSLNDGNECEYCKTFVKKIAVNVLGTTHYVQPACKCRAEELERFQHEQEQRSKRHSIERIFTLDSMGDRYADSSFDNFLHRAGTEEAFARCKRYAEEFKDEQLSLMIFGNPGNGKTHLAAAIANHLYEQNYTIVFQMMSQLLERIRSTFKSGNEREHDIMRALTRCDLLILDDFGTEKISDWVLDVVLRIVNTRYSNNLKTVYTSNYNPNVLRDRMKSFDEMQGARVFDRMLETLEVVQNKGTSYREERYKKRFRE